MQPLILLLGMSLLTVVAYCDVRSRRIPNELVVGILLLAALRIALTGDPSAALYTLAAGAAVFVATFLLFWRGLLGGGDVKLMAASAVLVGYHDVYGFLLVMSVCGALVALVVLAAHKLGLRLPTNPAISPAQQEDQEKRARLTVPYGLAIAAAGVLMLYVQFSPPG